MSYRPRSLFATCPPLFSIPRAGDQPARTFRAASEHLLCLRSMPTKPRANDYHAG